MGTKSSTTNTIIPVTFLHPRGGKEFSADIGPDTTGQKAIDGMIAAKFIEPPGLWLRRPTEIGGFPPLRRRSSTPDPPVSYLAVLFARAAISAHRAMSASNGSASSKSNPSSTMRA